MATIKSYTDIEQSRKLAKILPIEGADMYYSYYYNPISGASYYEEYPIFHIPINKNKSLPCWSLAALLNTIGHYTLQTVSDSKRVIVVSENGNPISSFSNPQPVDACYELILKLNELKML